MIVTENIDEWEAIVNNDQLANLLKQFWEIYSLGTNNAEMESFENDFLQSIEFIDSHYQIPLPWRGDVADISDHFLLSLNHLKLLVLFT